jgi:hypothetical protein
MSEKHQVHEEKQEKEKIRSERRIPVRQRKRRLAHEIERRWKC